MKKAKATDFRGGSSACWLRTMLQSRSCGPSILEAEAGESEV